ncbi:hypothetical protein D9M71_772640 [compost metagenome]
MIGIGITDMDVRFHGLVSAGLECRDEVSLVVEAQIPENEMEADVALRFSLTRPMAVGDIEARVRLFMPGEKRPKRIDYSAFSYVVRPD